MWEEAEIKNITCSVLRQGTAGPAFFWAYYPHEGQELQNMEEALKKLIPEASYAIAAFQVKDWNRDLSPWEAPMAFGEECFLGKAPETLKWLVNEYLPWFMKSYPAYTRCYIMGYSLAGLFALWSLYETDLFDGAICCSGSLWIDGWEEYAAGHGIQSQADVYLSLGGREEKTRNPRMALVGERTRNQEALLKKDPRVKRCTLEWNAGGHFADSAGRMAKGIRWIA